MGRTDGRTDGRSDRQTYGTDRDNNALPVFFEQAGA